MKAVAEAVRKYNIKAPIGMKRWIGKRSTFVPNWAAQTGALHGITVGPVSREAYSGAVNAKTEEIAGAVSDKGQKCMGNAKAGLMV